MKKIIYILILTLLLMMPVLHEAVSLDNNNPTLRVLIIDDRDRINLALKGRFKICEVNSDRVIMEGPYLSSDVRPTKEGLSIGSKEVKIADVKIKVVRDANIYVDGRRFRGDIDILKKENGKLMIVNHIALEDYLYGVLYHEVSHRWPAEALKAQAITARTFALYQARQSKLQPFDLRSDIYSQMYGGRTSEKWSTTRAVNLTRGKVLTYNGEIFPAYYHATCAGHTEDASSLWNVDLACLKGVPCNFCKDTPHYKWLKEIPLWTLQIDLKDNGYKIGKIVSVDVLSKNRSARVDKIEIKDDAGVSVIMTGKDFRQVVGPNEVRSTKFNTSVKWNSLVLNGFGWGHGVGMCQWGAYGMSKKHKKAEEIVKYYYPGAEITTIDKIKNKL